MLSSKKNPTVFDPEVVINQLRYSGMLETVKIRRAGFPVRRTFVDFLSRCVFPTILRIISLSLSLSLSLSPPQANPDFVRKGDFTLERMGVTYQAKAHLKSPFDPENKRVKGIYD